MAVNRRQIFTFNGLLALVAFCIFLGLATQYGRRTFFRDPSSAFYDKARAYDRFYSVFRQHDSERFMSKYGFYGLQESIKAGSKTQMCIVVPTVRRLNDESTYLYHTLGSILASITPVERTKLYINVFFAHADILDHPDGRASWLKALTDDHFSYEGHVNEEELQRISRANSNPGGSIEKRALDYAVALDSCYKQGSPYIAVLEDDILMAEGWFIKSLMAADEADGLTTQWLSLRIFNREILKVVKDAKSLVSTRQALIIVVWEVVAVLGYNFSKRVSRTARRHFDVGVLLVLCLLVIPVFTILFFQSGDAAIAPPRRGLSKDVNGCCSQAMLYNRDHIGQLIEYLRTTVRHSNLDPGPGLNGIIQQYAKQRSLDQFTFTPSQAQHMGYLGAISTESHEVELAWSMAFEQMDGLKLRRDHLELAKSMYGHDLDAA